MIQIQIPDEALDQLRTLLEKDGQMQWIIGDFIVDFWTEVQKYVDTSDTREAHAEVIRQFASGTGADRTTLRDREKMSMFFTKADRARFPLFTYHQFRALRKAGEGWEEYAEIAANNGYSVAQIRNLIDTEEAPMEVLKKRIAKLCRATWKIMDDETVPMEVRTSLSLIPTILEDTEELIYG
jgi:hypothetical protein